MSARVAADLRAAAELLRRDGWTQNTWTSADGCRCLQRALDDIYGPREVAGRGYNATHEDAAYKRLTDVIGTTRLIQWNDEPGRTADEVIAALEAAADAAEAES